MYLSTCLSTYLSIWPSVDWLIINLSNYPSIYRSACLYIYLSIYISLPIMRMFQSLETVPSSPVDKTPLPILWDDASVVTDNESLVSTIAPPSGVGGGVHRLLLSLELCKIHRDFRQLSSSRKRDRQTRRKEEKDRARHLAVGIADDRAREIRTSRQFLQTLKEQREVVFLYMCLLSINQKF